MREFLSARNIPFVERNIRRDPEAKAELLGMTGRLVVPVVVVGERHVVGYDPEGLESIAARTTGTGEATGTLAFPGPLVRASRQRGSEEGTGLPPGDSAQAVQGVMAAHPQADLAATIGDLVLRIREELAYNAAKAASAGEMAATSEGSPYRQGMHDGLRFAEEALTAILEQVGAPCG